MNGDCWTCERKMKIKSNTSPNKCDSFIEKHVQSCGSKFATVSNWFDLSKPEPKKCAIASRKTDRKLSVKVQKVVEEVPVVVAVPTVVHADDVIRDAMITSFPEQFDEDWKEYQEEDPDTVLQMIETVKTTLDSRTKQLDKLINNNQGVIEANKKQIEKRCALEIDQMDKYRMEETTRANKHRDDLEVVQIDLRTAERTQERQRQYIYKLQQLLRTSGIDFDTD